VAADATASNSPENFTQLSSAEDLPQHHDHHHPQAAPGSSGRISPSSTTHLQKTCTTIATSQMKLTIPTDQQLGHQLESIVRTIATIIAFVYVAGFTFGQAIHWLSANLTHLPAHAIDKLTTDHDSAHSPAVDPNSNHRPGPRRSRQPKPQPKHSGVGFA
jgi:hypothetical protein